MKVRTQTAQERDTPRLRRWHQRPEECGLRLEPVLDAPPTSKTVKSRQAWIYAQSGLLNEILGICGAPVTQKLPSARVDIVDTSWRLISSNLCVCNAVRRIRLTGPGCHDFLNLRGGCFPTFPSECGKFSSGWSRSNTRGGTDDRKFSLPRESRRLRFESRGFVFSLSTESPTA
jgi:hypothetical protein